MLNKFTFGLVVSLFACFAIDAVIPVCVADEFVFTNAKVFDGEKLVGPTSVVVRDSKIVAMGDDVKKSDESTVIDCTGKTILPGFIDAHVHAFFQPHLVQAAVFGVTTELDMMSNPQMARGLRAQQKSGQAIGRADLFSAGAAVTVANGHGTQFGMPVPTLETAEGAEAFVNERIREGSDYIKIIYEDGKAFGGSMPTLTKKMLENSITAAKAGKKLAVIHISSQPLATDAVNFGVHGFVHLFAESKIGDPLLEQIKAKKVFVTPTAAVITNAAGASSAMKFLKDADMAPFLTNGNLANLSKKFPVREGALNSWENLKHNIKVLHEAGVMILAGTDAPNPGTVHGASMHHELELLVEAGLSNLEALKSATSNPATAYGLDDRGVIGVGKKADLLIVDGNPVADIKMTRKIFKVFKDGVEVDRESVRLAVQEQAEKAAAKKGHSESKSRLVSDFNGDTVTAKFGAGWGPSTDSMMGGKSTAELAIVAGGIEDSTALKVSGTVQEKQPAFAGTMFAPGAGPMQKADLSGFSKISFWAKSDAADGGERGFQVMFFTEKGGFQPSMKLLKLSNKWEKTTIPFQEFDGTDGSDITGIWFGTNGSGDYEFQLDHVTLDP